MIAAIVERSDIDGVRYLVRWKSGVETWVEEEDMNCPELLVKFTEQNLTKIKEPHHMLKILLEALQGILKLARSSKPPTIVTLKRRLKELIGLGNPYLRSRRCIYDLETQLSRTNTLTELILLIDKWITQSNHVFAAE